MNWNNKIVFFFAFLLIVSIFGSCSVSLSGVSIDPNDTTFYIHDFENTALNTPAALQQRLRDRLDQKIRRNSRLVYNNTNPDIEFRGVITNYDNSSAASQANQTSALNRLTIKARIEYIPKDETKGWESTFSFFYDYDADQDLSEVEEDAITEIFDQMVEDIFNKAFTDW